MSSISMELVGTPAARKAQPWHGTGVLRQVLILTGRSLHALVSSPAIVVFGLIQPMVVLVLFSQVFSSISSTPAFAPGITYIDYLLPAVLVMGAMSSALTSGVGLVEDMRNGVINRFRAMPVAPFSIMGARSLADATRYAVQLGLMVIIAALVFDFRPPGGVPGVAVAWLLDIAIGWGIGWVFMAVACWVRQAELIQTITSMLMFPLMFASSAYVPIESLPGWLRVIAVVNPITYTVDASRGFALGHPVVNATVAALAVSAFLGSAGAVVAAKGFRRTA
jgi:ABC-2 type transport system permease protein